MEEALNLENRRKIYGFISKNPGTYLREMERDLGMQPGLLSYHLDYLERRELLRIEDDGYRKRYFPGAEYKLKGRKVISLLRLDSPRKILIHLLVNGSTSFRDLLPAVGVSKSTLSYNMKKLTAAGVVQVVRSERELVYRVDDPDEVADLLISIRESLENDAVDRFVDIWSKLSG
ncbi:MAG: helix-turn-helix domain-containing protein [Methanomassiliicoccales archaeon]|nr:helix-turn-helix domain-containing protein [Methanomassiliicoccales archaeon]